MGVDLTLLPFYNEDADFSLTVLNLDRDYDLQGKISDLNMLNVPEKFNSFLSRDDEYEDSHFGITTIDSYGEHVKYTTVEELLKLKDFVDKSKSFINTAVWAYLDELPYTHKVALFWH